MSRNRRTQAARLRERVRAAQAHPAAARRALYRSQRRQLAAFGVAMVRAGHGRPGDFLAAFVLDVICKFNPGITYRYPAWRAVWQCSVERLTALVERVVFLAACSAGRVVGVEQSSARQRHVVTVAQPTRGPGSVGPARTVRGALVI